MRGKGGSMCHSELSTHRPASQKKKDERYATLSHAMRQAKKENKISPKGG